MILGEPWTKQEIERLKILYPKSHRRKWVLQDAFPDRTRRAIARAANKQGLKRQKFRRGYPISEIIELKERRMKAGITTHTLAEKMGWGQPQIYAWEVGKRRMSKLQLQDYNDTLEGLGA